MALIMTGALPKRLHLELEPKLSPARGTFGPPDLDQELEVTVKLHLIIPNADKKDSQFREVTSDNYQECFSLLSDSALFEFGALDLTHPISPDEESGRQVLSKKLRTVFHLSCCLSCSRYNNY